MTLVDSIGIFLAALGGFGVMASAFQNGGKVYTAFQWASVVAFALGLALLAY